MLCREQILILHVNKIKTSARLLPVLELQSLESGRLTCHQVGRWATTSPTALVPSFESNHRTYRFLKRLAVRFPFSWKTSQYDIGTTDSKKLILLTNDQSHDDAYPSIADWDVNMAAAL
jgi:hypothetical protein